MARTPARKVPAGTGADAFAEFGTTGLLRTYDGLVFDEYLPELQGYRWHQTIRRMLDDATVAAILQAISMLIRGVEWRVKAASEKSEDQKRADFVRSCLGDMSQSWTDTINEILSFLPYGWSAVEIVYKLRGGDVEDPTRRSRFNDGLIGWRKLPLRGQDTLVRWLFDPDDCGITGLVQRGVPDGRERTIPVEKMLLFRTTTYRGNPQGRSLLRPVWHAWTRKNRVDDVEIIGVERDLAGLPMMLVPGDLMNPDASPADKTRFQACQNLVSQVRRDQKEGVILPSDRDEHGQPFYDLRLLSTGGRRNFDTGQIIQRHDQRMAMSVLADFILLGMDRVGSFALSSSKTALFARSLAAYLDHIQDVFNRYAIPRLFKLNGEPLDDLPELEHGDIESPDLGELGSYVQALAGAQVPLADKAAVDYLRTAAGLPESEEGEQRPVSAGGEAKPAAAAPVSNGAAGPAGAPPAVPTKPAAAGG